MSNVILFIVLSSLMVFAASVPTIIKMKFAKKNNELKAQIRTITDKYLYAMKILIDNSKFRDPNDINNFPYNDAIISLNQMMDDNAQYKSKHNCLAKWIYEHSTFSIYINNEGIKSYNNSHYQDVMCFIDFLMEIKDVMRDYEHNNVGWHKVFHHVITDVRPFNEENIRYLQNNITMLIQIGFSKAYVRNVSSLRRVG